MIIIPAYRKLVISLDTCSTIATSALFTFERIYEEKITKLFTVNGNSHRSFLAQWMQLIKTGEENKERYQLGILFWGIMKLPMINIKFFTRISWRFWLTKWYHETSEWHYAWRGKTRRKGKQFVPIKNCNLFRLLLVFMWRQGGHVGDQNNSLSHLWELNFIYFCANYAKKGH